MGSSLVGGRGMLVSAAAAISATLRSFFLRAKKIMRKMATAMRATPPMAPPTMGPMGVDDLVVVMGAVVFVVFVKLVKFTAKV